MDQQDFQDFEDVRDAQDVVVDGADPFDEGAPRGAAAGAGPDPRLRAAGGVAGAVALLAAVWALVDLLRRRRRPPTTTERLAQVAGQATQLAEHAAQTYASAVREVAGKALPVAQTTARTTARTAAAAAHSGQEVAGQVAEQVVESLGEVSSAVAEGVGQVHRWWSRLVFRLLAATSFGTGYVLGAKAGRERYEQIAATARRLSGQLQG